MEIHKLTFLRRLLSLLGLWWLPQYYVCGEVKLGGMESWGFNGIRSGVVSLMSPNKLKIREFDYTGEGPAVWFMVGKEEEPYNEEFAELKGTIIPDETGSCSKLVRYKNENIVLTLPKGMNFTNYDYLAVYCTRFNHNFGYVQLRRDVNPEQMAPMSTEELPKACPQDHLEDEEDDAEEEEDEEKEEEEEEEEDDRNRRRRHRGKFNAKKALRKTSKSSKNVTTTLPI